MSNIHPVHFLQPKALFSAGGYDWTNQTNNHRDPARKGQG